MSASLLMSQPWCVQSIAVGRWWNWSSLLVAEAMRRVVVQFPEIFGGGRRHFELPRSQALACLAYPTHCHSPLNTRFVSLKLMAGKDLLKGSETKGRQTRSNTGT
jgi:hypothetical protein